MKKKKLKIGCRRRRKKLRKQICLLLKEENKVDKKKTEYKRSDCYLKCLFHTMNNLQIIT